MSHPFYLWHFTSAEMSLKKRLDSVGFALKGLVDLFQSQPNARLHLIATLMVVMAGTYFQLSKLEWAAIVICIALVLSLEAMNTAIEYLTDLVSPDFHPLAGKAKDVAAAGVLLAAIGAVLVGAIIFFPKILNL